MLQGSVKVIAKALRGIMGAVRARTKVFLVVALGMFVLNLFLPLVVLSLARKPWDFFTFNPWLSRLPEYLASSDVPLGRKLQFLPNLVLWWFSAASPYGGIDWGFAVDVRGLLRFIFMSLLFGAYFALWFYRRDQLAHGAWGARASRHGGVAGALAGTLGFSTGPCSVVGCGAPIMPVVGLAFTGLSSGTIALLSETSKVATAIVLSAMTLGVGYFGWLVGADSRESRVPRS